MESIKLAHLFPTFRNLGGVESILRHHHAKDAGQGLDGQFVIYSEHPQDAMDRVHFLGLGPTSSIADLRRAVGTVLRKFQPEVVLYHGTWGMHYLAGVDQARRRLLILHSETPGLEAELTARAGWLDGVLGVSPPLAALARRCLPQLGENRIGLVPYPIAPPPNRSSPSPAGRPLVLGFCSRLVVEQKRVDRLPKLCRLLDARRVEYRLEFLGAGPEQAWLEAQFPDRSKFVFHGRKQGDAYWEVLRTWDAIVFVSDYEGTPIALLEAASMGVVPVFPKIGSGGDQYAAEICPTLLYPAGDLAAAGAIEALAQLPVPRREDLRGRARAGSAPHCGNAYLSKVASFIRLLAAAERISHSNPVRRMFPIDRLSFKTLERLAQARRQLTSVMGKR